jgi:hypothetical protein
LRKSATSMECRALCSRQTITHIADAFVTMA